MFLLCILGDFTYPYLQTSTLGQPALLHPNHPSTGAPLLHPGSLCFALGVGIQSKTETCTEVIAALRMSAKLRVGLRCLYYIVLWGITSSEWKQHVEVQTTCALSLFHMIPIVMFILGLCHAKANFNWRVMHGRHGPSYVSYVCCKLSETSRLTHIYDEVKHHQVHAMFGWLWAFPNTGRS